MRRTESVTSGYARKHIRVEEIAVASLLKQKITIHDITLPIGPADSSTDLPSYDINNRVEQALVKRVTATDRISVRLQPSDRERLIELKQASYLAYPNYNSDLKPRGPKFTDYSADEQAKCLSLLDQIIEEELTKSLAALGL
jgi:hypothetical protein